jgi:ammonia channel protein AmtB
VWLLISWAKNKPSTVALLNGVIAGLAGITPASGTALALATPQPELARTLRFC